MSYPTVSQDANCKRQTPHGSMHPETSLTENDNPFEIQTPAYEWAQRYHGMAKEARG